MCLCLCALLSKAGHQKSVRVLELPSWKKKNQTCPVKTKAIYGSDGDMWQPTHKDAHRIRNAGIFLLCKIT